MHYLLATGLSIAAIAILFALQNPTLASVRFLVWRLEMPLALLTIVIFAIGATAGVLCLLPSLLRQLATLNQQRRRLQELQAALAESDAIQASQDKRIRYLETHLQADDSPEAP